MEYQKKFWHVQLFQCRLSASKKTTTTNSQQCNQYLSRTYINAKYQYCERKQTYPSQQNTQIISVQLIIIRQNTHKVPIYKYISNAKTYIHNGNFKSAMFEVKQYHKQWAFKNVYTVLHLYIFLMSNILFICNFLKTQIFRARTPQIFFMYTDIQRRYYFKATRGPNLCKNQDIKQGSSRTLSRRIQYELKKKVLPHAPVILSGLHYSHLLKKSQKIWKKSIFFSIFLQFLYQLKRKVYIKYLQIFIYNLKNPKNYC
eukprot:TRINITY_DN2316_c1_g1_i1.p1 TRINITY_DN2316_c1_g1~~TRINITY_DN2316_c1_g1_i1.p1  ORF type:complete len:257 (+),score=-16.75 TRINITY_DN2316_c1_g1_i1:838-1608(+)